MEEQFSYEKVDSKIAVLNYDANDGFPVSHHK